MQVFTLNQINGISAQLEHLQSTAGVTWVVAPSQRGFGSNKSLFVCYYHDMGDHDASVHTDDGQNYWVEAGDVQSEQSSFEEAATFAATIVQ